MDGSFLTAERSQLSDFLTAARVLLPFSPADMDQGIAQTISAKLKARTVRVIAVAGAKISEGRSRCLQSSESLHPNLEQVDSSPMKLSTDSKKM